MNIKQKVALSSVFASIFLTIFKLIVGLLTGSLGILSEAAHSFLDFGAALLTYFAVRIGDKPPDPDHPYGHGKVENVSAFIETGLLFLTSLFIVYEAVKRFFYGGSEIEVTWYAYLVMIISIIIDFSRSRALSKIAKQTKSHALEADALHFSSDILSSLVVILGLMLTSLGITKADTIAAIGVSIFVLKAGYNLGKRTIDVLVDTSPQGVSEKVLEIVKTVKGVVNVEKIRVRVVGPTVFIDLSVTVSRKMAFEKVQKISKIIEEKIKKEIEEADVTISTKPLTMNNETITERVNILASNHDLTAHDIVVHDQNNKKYVSFDLEINKKLSIKKAHKLATHLEKSIKNEVGENVEINSHIEPVVKNIITGNTLSINNEKRVKTKILQVVKKIKQVKNVHNILIRKSKNKYFTTLHCSFSNKTSLENTHDIANKLEYMIKKEIPSMQRVVIHAEPMSESKGHFYPQTDKKLL